MATYNPNQYSYNTYVVGGQVVDPSKKGPRYPWDPVTNPPFGSTPQPDPTSGYTNYATQPTPNPQPATDPVQPPVTQQDQTTKPPAQRADYSSDPILQQLISQQTNVDIPEAQSRLLEGQKQALLALGSRSLAEQYLGKTDPYLQNISDDPYNAWSALAQIGRKYSYDPALQGQGWQLREDLNKGNLFYGGFRNLQETGLGRNRMQEQVTAEQTTQGQLMALRNAWQEQMSGIRGARQTAESEAYGRWLQNLLAGGGTDTATGGGEAGTAPTTGGNFPGLAGDPNQYYGGYVPGSYTGANDPTAPVTQPFTGDLSSPQEYYVDPADGQVKPKPQGYVLPPYQYGYQ